MNINRRQFIKSAAAVTAATVPLTGYGAYSFEQAAHFDQLMLKHYTIQDGRLPQNLDLKIGFATDFHVGCTIVGLDTLHGIVDQINTLTDTGQIDILCLGGDYQNNTLLNRDITKPYPTAKEIAAVFGGLHQKDKVFGVMGNHDWALSDDAILYAMREQGIQMLENDQVILSHKETAINLVGLPDYKERYALNRDNVCDNMRDMFGRLHDQSTIVLGHDPFTNHFVPSDAILAMYGHTHGWQIPTPEGRPLPFTKPTAGTPDDWGYGEVHPPGLAPMFVSSGIGHSTVPFRTIASELVVITINPAQPRF